MGVFGVLLEGSHHVIESIGSENIFRAILGFSWVTFAWEEYLAYRQNQVAKRNADIPKELEGFIDNETFKKSRLYAIDKSNYSLVESIYSQLFSTGIMVYGGLPLLWQLSGRAIGRLGYENEILQTMAFVAIGSTISTVLSLPWSYYFTFYIEQKHGFNKETVGFFCKDKLKKFCVSQLISAPVVGGLVFIIKTGGEYFFFYLWLFTTSMLMFFMTVYPDFIAPLFDTYEPLKEGELKSSIEALAARIDFPLKKLYVVIGSMRSAHSNAYFYGFFNNKRIVLYDTLLKDYITTGAEESAEGEEEKEPLEKKHKPVGCDNEEVLAVLGHELGHWKLNHVLKGICISQVNLMLVFSVFALLSDAQPLYAAFGFQQKPAFIGLLIVMQFVFAPYNEVLTLLMNMFSRHNEYEADRFAASLQYTEQLKSALVKLNTDNLSFPVHDALFSAWHHSHPPLLARLRALSDMKEE